MSDAGNVNFRALQLFIAVYDSQSFSVVARREGVSPSMVSRVIHQLEDSLGQQLFYRNTRAVVPTEAGRLFAEHARGISEQFSAARRDLQDRSLEPGGLVRINAPVYFGQRHIAPWLPGLSERYPQMQIELALTDDFIDPHREATDVIFRIGSLPECWGCSITIWLPPRAICSVAVFRSGRKIFASTVRWCTAVQTGLTAGYFASRKANGFTIRKPRSWHPITPMRC